jgi:Domain of unknown function (DUF6468)
MSESMISLAAEALVAVLLIVTIVYCVILNSRLKRLRADESVLRATISELVTATEIAERAIGGLKVAATECDKSLATRVREAEYFSIEIAREIGEGQQVLDRIKQIATAVRRSETTEKSPQKVLAEKSDPKQPPELPKAAVSTGSADESVTKSGESVTRKPAAAATVAAPKEDDRLTSPATSSKASHRIEELKVLAEQARLRLRDMRRTSAEKAA